jgi:hypothetical protein
MAPARTCGPRRRRLHGASAQISFHPGRESAKILAGLCVTLFASGSPSRLGGHGHETVVKLRCALFRRTAGNCVAVRPGRHRPRADRNRRRHRAARGHGACAAAGGKAAPARAGGAAGTGGGKTRAGGNTGAGKRRCIPPRLAAFADTIARTGFSHGEACRAGANQRQLPRRLPDQLQTRQRPLARMLAVRRCFLHHLPQPAQLQKLHRVPRHRTVPRLEAQRRPMVLLEPGCGGAFQGRGCEAGGKVGGGDLAGRASGRRASILKA